MMNMKRFFTSVSFGMLFAMTLGAFISWAQETAPTPVNVRAAKHQDYVRIVLTTDDFLVNNALIILAKNKTIRVDFRSLAAATAEGREKPVIVFQTEKGPMKNDAPAELIKSVNLAAKGDICIITIPNVEDIKVSKLRSPSRIVIDAFLSAASKEVVATTVPLKPLADAISFKYIVVDPGHGGYDYGIRGTHFAEKDFVLLFAKEFAALLAKSGKEVLLTRKSDQIMTLTERIASINKRPPDLVISFHVAATKVPVLYTVPEKPDSGSEAPAAKTVDQLKREVAKSIADAIAANMEKDLSLKTAEETLPLSLLVRSKAPAILIELPNPDEFTYDKKSREWLMSSILKGLAAGAKDEKPSSQPAPKQEAKPLNKNAGKVEKM